MAVERYFRFDWTFDMRCFARWNLLFVHLMPLRSRPMIGFYVRLANMNIPELFGLDAVQMQTHVNNKKWSKEVLVDEGENEGDDDDDDELSSAYGNLKDDRAYD